MNRLVKYCYIVLYVVLMLFMFFALVFGKNRLFSHGSVDRQAEIFPVSSNVIDEDSVEMYFDFSRETESGMALRFLTSHQQVAVFADGECIYKLEAAPSILGISPGTIINFVELPEATSELHVVLTAAYAAARNPRCEFYYGDALAMQHSLIKKSLSAFVLSCLIVAVGVALVCYWFIMRRRFVTEIAICFFGLFAIILGLWSLNETDIAMLMIQNRTVGSMLGYMLLLLLPVPFIQFVRNFFGIADEKVANVLSLLAISIGAILPILHITHVAEFKQTAVVIHLMLIVSIFYMAGAIIYCIKRNGMTHRIKVNLIATIALLASLFADLFAYYRGFQQTDVLGKIGAMIYIIVLSIEALSDIFRKLQEGKKAEFYRIMAETDVMTGLLNRSAFEAWEERHTHFDDVLIVTFDLNDLKETNDSLGHKAGDTYIVEAALIIKRVFGNIGKCYRIGGDEFCVVIHRGSKIKVEHFVEELRKEEKDYNAKHPEFKMEIAVGYAIFDAADNDFENTRERADEKMYRNKLAIKKKR